MNTLKILDELRIFANIQLSSLGNVATASNLDEKLEILNKQEIVLKFISKINELTINETK